MQLLIFCPDDLSGRVSCWSKPYKCSNCESPNIVNHIQVLEVLKLNFVYAEN